MFSEIKTRSRVLLHLAKNLTRNHTNMNNFRIRGGERFSSTDANASTIQSYLTSRFTTEEQNLILRTINTCAIEELKRYRMNEGRIKKLIAYRDKNRGFDTLDDVLLLPGIDVAVLDKFCRSITKKESKARSTRRSDLVLPPLDERTRLAIETCTGVWVCGDIVSWAKVNANCDLLRWDCQNITDVPAKEGLVTRIGTVAKIVSTIPTSDVYVMESDPIVPFSRVRSTDYHSHLQRQQIITTIVSVLGTRKHYENVSDEEDNARWIDDVYMIRSRTPARLFDLLVGSEIVSARSVVEKILEGNYDDEENGVKISVKAFPDIEKHYKSRNLYQREQMNWALLLTASFINLSVLGTAASKKTNATRGDAKKKPKNDR